MSKKSKTPVKGFYVSRDKLCPWALEVEPGNCELPVNVHTEDSYSVVYFPSHLEIKKYSCGCLIYFNKYHPEFKFPEVIWMDFFNVQISQGEKLVKFTINRSAKK